MKKFGRFAPLRRQRLSDEVVERVLALIESDNMRAGDRLPPIAEMARSLGVASTTMREALMRLEAKDAIAIRQGSGVFVGQPVP